MMRYGPLYWALGAAGIIVTAFLLYFSFERHSSFYEYHSAIVDRMPYRSHLLDDVFNATLGFERIFVVNLPSRTDRRDNMVLQAAVSNMEFEFVDGVDGNTIPPKAVPMDDSERTLGPANIGSWRGHMNAVNEIVRRNLTSALILEDDLDWDIRLKEQLRDLALSTRALIQPLKSSPDSYADPTYPVPRKNAPAKVEDMDFKKLPETIEPTVSPYGDGWDVLWIGHCGLSFPFKTSTRMPKGRVIRRNDVTVAPKKNLWSWNSPFSLIEDYPEHTRAVTHAQEGLCTLAYAVSQSGARKLLADVALKPPTDAFDFLLRFYCEGARGRNYHNCLGVNPALFNHYKAAGPLISESDIGHHEGYRNESESDMIRWSTRLNIEKLMDGRTDFVDQYPDVKKKPKQRKPVRAEVEMQREEEETQEVEKQVDEERKQEEDELGLV